MIDLGVTRLRQDMTNVLHRVYVQGEDMMLYNNKIPMGYLAPAALGEAVEAAGGLDAALALLTAEGPGAGKA